ncbi:Uncharacterised protein [uncultured archaeon]|nr:Uncharacterised protein [uncultured archaeon]
MIKQLGPPAFVAGFLLSVIAAVFWPLNGIVAIVVACLGVIVGLLNIQDKEVPGFLLATIAFTVSAGSLGVVFGQLYGLTTAAPAFFNYIVTFVAPAAGVVAFKQLWLLAKD